MRSSDLLEGGVCAYDHYSMKEQNLGDPERFVDEFVNAIEKWRPKEVAHALSGSSKDDWMSWDFCPCWISCRLPGTTGATARRCSGAI